MVAPIKDGFSKGGTTKPNESQTVQVKGTRRMLASIKVKKLPGTKSCFPGVC